MSIYFADIETDGLNPTKIHCISVMNSKTRLMTTFTDIEEFELWFNPDDVFVFHNGIAFDVPVIERLTKVKFNHSKIIDTFVVSRLWNYGKFNTHSLEEWGKFLNVFKTDYDGGWEELTDEMVDYCEQDVRVTEAIFKYLSSFISNKNNKKSLRLEHDIAFLCHEMHVNGFPFDKDRAESLLIDVKSEMEDLEEGFKNFVGTKRVEDRRLKLRYKKDGTMHSTCLNAILEHPDATIDGEEIVIYKDQEFNPGSPKQRIDVLWEYGWNPFEKTKGHLKHDREANPYWRNKKWR